MNERINKIFNEYLNKFINFADKSDYLTDKTRELFSKLLLKEFNNDLQKVLDREKFIEKNMNGLYKLLARQYKKKRKLVKLLEFASEEEALSEGEEETQDQSSEVTEEETKDQLSEVTEEEGNNSKEKLTDSCRTASTD